MTEGFKRNLSREISENCVYGEGGGEGIPDSDLINKVAGDTNLNYKLHKNNKNWDGINDEFDARYVEFQLPKTCKLRY